ncbi:MAG TPA: hypothetical protein VIH76_20155 [Candidatus Acidoferrales bacterium]
MCNRSTMLAAALFFFFAVCSIFIPARTTARAADSPVPRLPWLHEGLVLTYTWYAAVAPGNGSYYEEDDHGDMILHSTGQRYLRTTQTGTSGSGWTQITVASIDGDKVVLESSSYGNAGSLGRNAPVPQGTSSSVAALMDPGDYWMDPAKLASLQSAPAEHILVSRVAWKAGDNNIDGIRVQVINGTSYSDHIYDAKTGLCVHVASSSRGAPPKLVGPGDFGRGDTTITRNDFVNSRDITIPWASEPTPDWVASIRALHYRGSITSHGPLPTVPNVLTLDMEATARGHNWVQFTATSTQRTQGAPEIPPSKSELASGRSELDGLWAGPAALAQLRQGQILDEDPVTKMRTVVSRVDDSSVIITASNAAGEIDNQYDKHTGMLIASSFYNVLSMQQRTLKLQGHE